MTRELFREDAYLRTHATTVTAADERGLQVAETVFYPMGGGQPGDCGTLRLPDGTVLRITDTRKGEAPGEIIHLVEEGTTLPSPGAEVVLDLDWERRYRHMRMHTCLHVLTAVVPGPVNGGSVRADSGRLDFDLQGERLDKAEIERKLNALIAAGAQVSTEWITEEELQARPELVKTISVKPPAGFGRVRLLRIAGIDLQACGGTHLANISEIGQVLVTKVESKGKQNRRVSIAFV